MVILGVAPQLASAEASSDIGGGSLSADAHLNLKVVIPGFLLFRVGSAGATVDTITFNMTSCVTGGSCTVGDGTAITAATGGNSGGNGVSVELFSNAGPITIRETNNTGVAGLVDGSSNKSIDLAEITTSSSNTSLNPPILSNDTENSSSATLTSGTMVTAQTAIWSYSYENKTVPDPGTYDVEITYTASSP